MTRWTTVAIRYDEMIFCVTDILMSVQPQPTAEAFTEGYNKLTNFMWSVYGRKVSHHTQTAT